MYREVIEQLESWKHENEKQFLLFGGSMRVGKTTVLKEFAEMNFKKSAYFDLRNDDDIEEYLNGDEVTKEGVQKFFEEQTGTDSVKDTLIIIEHFDLLGDMMGTMRFLEKEFSECRFAITTIVNEKMVMKRFEPVSDLITCINLRPLSFREFLYNIRREDLVKKIDSLEKRTLTSDERKSITEYMRKYLYIGGMPEVVNVYIETGNMDKVYDAKKKFIGMVMEKISRMRDFPLRHKVKQVWESIPEQLEKDNKKFQFGTVKITARSREYNAAVEWLYKYKYIQKVHRVKDVKVPLEENFDIKSFEVYLNDVGILGAMYNIRYEELESVSKIIQIRNKAIVEQFVLQELIVNPEVRDLFYWISGATARVEFIYEKEGKIKPVEVNLYHNTKAQSAKVFKQRYEPEKVYSILYDGMTAEDDMVRLPMYGIKYID